MSRMLLKLARIETWTRQTIAVGLEHLCALPVLWPFALCELCVTSLRLEMAIILHSPATK